MCPWSLEMELYVSGFNAWGQLCLEEFPNGENNAVETHDVTAFTSVLEVNPTSRVRVRAVLSYTEVTGDRATRIVAGYVPSEHKRLQENDPRAYETLAEASNGLVAYLDSRGAVHQFATLHNALHCTSEGHTRPDLPTCTQLVAYETGFMALTLEGNVYTWGDERYRACLGRDPTPGSAGPAGEPGLVTALQDLPTGPIVKIAAGGYTLAALTEGNDLYIWGGHPGRKTFPTDLSDVPTPLDLGDVDIADVAIGESHMLILTVSGCVLAIGSNSNGQLGALAESVESWTRVELNLPVGRRALHIAAGPRNSFVVVGTNETS